MATGGCKVVCAWWIEVNDGSATKFIALEWTSPK